VRPKAATGCAGCNPVQGPPSKSPPPMPATPPASAVPAERAAPAAVPSR